MTLADTLEPHTPQAAWVELRNRLDPTLRFAKRLAKTEADEDRADEARYVAIDLEACLRTVERMLEGMGR